MIRRLLLAVLLLAAVTATVHAEEQPLWELGVGIGSAWFPHYRGADDGRAYVLPVPYFVYRGERLRVGRRGIFGRIFQTDRVRLGLSADLGPPADSERSSAREGMPDLDPVFGIGPSLNVRLFENAARTRRLELRLPARAVFATDLSSIDYTGWVFLPHLDYGMRNVGPGGRWSASLSFGPIWASNDLHDYYYAVAPEFARADRPAYDAPGGFSGWSAGLTVSQRTDGYWVGAFVRYDDLSGVAFEESPLLQTEGALMWGLAVVKIIARSERRVPVGRER